MKLLQATFLSLIIISSLVSADEDQSNMQFEQGSVVIHCAAHAEDQQISTDVFNEAFPYWLTKLQTHADEGRIARAHYLNELKEGILIVVPGKNREEAMSQALEIQAENDAIMQDALAKAGMTDSNFDSKKNCQFIEIGPVAVLPR